MFIPLDVERNELVLMIHNKITDNKVIKEAKYCENKPNIVDKALWLISALESLAGFQAMLLKEAKLNPCFH